MRREGLHYSQTRGSFPCGCGGLGTCPVCTPVEVEQGQGRGTVPQLLGEVAVLLRVPVEELSSSTSLQVTLSPQAATSNDWLIGTYQDPGLVVSRQDDSAGPPWLESLCHPLRPLLQPHPNSAPSSFVCPRVLDSRAPQEIFCL